MNRLGVRSHYDNPFDEENRGGSDHENEWNYEALVPAKKPGEEIEAEEFAREAIQKSFEDRGKKL